MLSESIAYREFTRVILTRDSTFRGERDKDSFRLEEPVGLVA